MSKNYEILYKGKTEEVKKIDDVIENIIYTVYDNAIANVNDGHYPDWEVESCLEDSDVTELKPDGVTDDEFRAAIGDVAIDIWGMPVGYASVDTSSVIPDLKRIREEKQLTPLTRNTKISPLRNSQDE